MPNHTGDQLRVILHRHVSETGQPDELILRNCGDEILGWHARPAPGSVSTWGFPYGSCQISPIASCSRDGQSGSR